jgi:hypothetical protein
MKGRKISSEPNCFKILSSQAIKIEYKKEGNDTRSLL